MSNIDGLSYILAIHASGGTLLYLGLFYVDSNPHIKVLLTCLNIDGLSYILAIHASGGTFLYLGLF